MAAEEVKQKFSGSINELMLGKGDSAVKVGGETGLPFLFKEGKISNPPRIAFEVWDIDNNKQLAVSFRDQGKDSVWNLLPIKTNGDYSEQSREYFFIHALEYNPVEPNASVTRNGGHMDQNMYFMWPYLAEDAVWNPDSLPESELIINWGYRKIRFRNTTIISDAYNVV